MRTKLIFLLSSLCAFSFAQISVTNIEAGKLPSEAKFKGKVASAITWKDKQGVHYVIEAETPLLMTNAAKEASVNYKLVENPISGQTDTILNYELVNLNGKMDTVRNIEADYRIKGLFVYHYVDNGKGISLLWKNLDNVNECSYKNLEANYLCAPIVTDLDNNGIGEVWFVYQLGCRADKSVALGIKQVLYIDAQRYSIRGTRLVRTGNKTDGGEVRADKEFEQLPQVYRDYALKLWGQYKEEK